MAEDMPFEEFRHLMLTKISVDDGDEDDLALGAFQNLLRQGCTAQEAKIWLGKHIWDFSDRLRESLIMGFAADAIQEAAKKADGPKEARPVVRESHKVWRRETQDKNGKVQVWETTEPPPKSFAEYEATYGRLHARGGVGLAWPYAWVYEHGRKLK